MAEGAVLYPSSVADALRMLRQHTAVRSVAEPEALGDCRYRVVIDVEVELPSRAKAVGRSKTGVQHVEPVVLDFGPGWPIDAPEIGLRPEFPQHLPHINPCSPGELVRPCVFQGSLAELLHRQGLDGIVDQIADWLTRAAGDDLIDLHQGWEPTRRDDTAGTMVFSASSLIELLPKNGSLVSLPTAYRVFGSYPYVQIESTPDCKFKSGFQQEVIKIETERFTYGRTYTFLAVAPDTDGKERVFDEYEPETVKTLPDLLAKAARLGIDAKNIRTQLLAFHEFSQKESDVFGWSEGFLVGIVLAARRPAKLIGSIDQTVELLPYLLSFRATTSGSFLDCATVEGCFHESALSPELLARTSGLQSAVLSSPITLIGCGSLGSKLGLHLGRAGFGSMTFVDNDRFSTHNSARHALLPPETILPLAKVSMMQAAFARLGHMTVKAYQKDAATDVLQERGSVELSRGGRALIIDTSASLRVLEALCRSRLSDRLVRVALYGQGGSCVMMLEGANRSVRVDDLQAYLFSLCRTESRLRQQLAGDNSSQERFFVGQNCSSVTTLMPDSKISRSAAMVSMQLEEWLQSGFPADGLLCLGLSDSAGIGMSWRQKALAATTVLTISDKGGWEVRLLPAVVEAINSDVTRWGPLETGGALLGHISQARRCLIISDVVPAPPDSKRSRGEFVLGRDGLEEALRSAHADSLAHLHFIGTWHSHPMGGRHSNVDFRTLEKIAKSARGLPGVSLVWTPFGFQCAIETFG